MSAFSWKLLGKAATKTCWTFVFGTEKLLLITKKSKKDKSTFTSVFFLFMSPGVYITMLQFSIRENQEGKENKKKGKRLFFCFFLVFCPCSKKRHFLSSSWNYRASKGAKKKCSAFDKTLAQKANKKLTWNWHGCCSFFFFLSTLREHVCWLKIFSLFFCFICLSSPPHNLSFLFDYV